MHAKLGHILVNIDPTNAGFYRDLLGFLGWDRLHDSDGVLGFGGGDGASLWFMAPPGDGLANHDARGAVNHVAFAAGSQAEVDATASWLAARGIAAQFETPRHRPEFAAGPGQTYYQVMFESPDGVLFEVVYTGPKS
ncbi:VOC family protein [Tepidiforma sp.]|uniref:VOC family protein n=1 Tax=Tepidiforma sp. TaxID=2682230 RepID=UPI002ADDDEAC|nr:VOC family protein [Tepidiforma sp.]